MLTTERFLEIIDGAKGRATDSQVCQAAGVPITAIRTLRKGSAPSLDRAAQIAEGVGLELCLRRRTEGINALVLELATLYISREDPAWPNKSAFYVRKLLALYDRFEPLFPIDDVLSWDAIFSATKSVILESAAGADGREDGAPESSSSP